jgi:hypothetical protein
MAIVMLSEAQDCDEPERVTVEWAKSIADCQLWSVCLNVKSVRSTWCCIGRRVDATNCQKILQTGFATRPAGIGKRALPCYRQPRIISGLPVIREQFRQAQTVLCVLSVLPVTGHHCVYKLLVVLRSGNRRRMFAQFT